MFNEFSALKKILEKLGETNRNHPALIVPPGDDAALLASLSRPVISTDTQREGVHFRLDWQTPFEVGYKSVVVALSDLAASYAKPFCLFINLGLPKTVNEILIEELYDGVKSALSHYSCSLGGGNISASSELSLDLFAVGEGETCLFPMRSKALAGEGLYATGPLGLARAGLMCLEQDCMDFPDLVAHFKKPLARFDAAKVLSGYNVACVMDLSDGLAGDAGHMALASDITIRFHIEQDHVPPSLETFCRRFNSSPQEMMISGGEDYELLFSCAPDVFEKIRKHLPQAFRVGSCLPFTGVRLEGVPATCRSFVHGDNEGKTSDETV